MIYINKISYMCIKTVRIQIYSLYLNEVRKNLASPGKPLLRCSTIGTPNRYVPVGDLDRSPLIHSYGYASAGDQPTLFAIFPLTSFPSCNMRARSLPDA